MPVPDHESGSYNALEAAVKSEDLVSPFLNPRAFRGSDFCWIDPQPRRPGHAAHVYVEVVRSPLFHQIVFPGEVPAGTLYIAVKMIELQDGCHIRLAACASGESATGSTCVRVRAQVARLSSPCTRLSCLFSELGPCVVL